MEKQFFLTKQEIIKSLKELEQRTSIKYIRAGKYDFPEVEEYEGIEEITTFGINRSGCTDDISYLILKEHEMVNIREIKVEKGIKFEIELKDNPEAVQIFPGGLYKYKDLISGKLVYNEGEKNHFQRNLVDAILFETTLKNDFHCGKEIYTIEKNGGKLVKKDIKLEESI